MPSRKVRRRRAKLKRHEYEYVIETDEGEEIPVERPAGREKGSDASPRSDRGPVDRHGREIPKPSLHRVLKRTAIFAPLLFVLVYVTQGNALTTVGIVANVVILLAFFMPFTYFVDVLVYRMLTRRQRRQGSKS